MKNLLLNSLRHPESDGEFPDTARRLPSGAYERLKTATRRQIKAAGGLQAAAKVTRVRKSQLGAYQAPDHRREFMPIDVVADLMADGGGRDVLEGLAALAGCAVVPLKLDGDGADLAHDFAALGEYVAQAFHDYATAVKKGSAEGKTAARIDDDLERVVRIAMHARALLRGARPKRRQERERRPPG